MRLLGLLILVWGLGQPLEGQRLEVGIGGASPQGDQTPSWSWAEIGGLSALAGRAQWPVPSGVWTLNWDAFEASTVWLGWEGTTPAGHTEVRWWVAPIPPIAFQWQTVALTAALSTATGWTIDHRWQDWSWGGALAVVRGDTLWSTTLDAGDVDLRALGAYIGWRSFRVALGRLAFSAHARVNLLGADLVKLDDDLVLWGAGGAGSWDWTGDLWAVRLGYGIGAGWVTNGTFSVQRQWWEWTTSPFPGFQLQSASNDYRWEGYPGFVAYLHPQVVWSPGKAWTVRLERWLPVAWGWKVTTGPQGTEVAPATVGGVSSSIPWSALWWSGTALSLAVEL